MRSPAVRFLVLLFGLSVAASHAPAAEEDKGKEINGVCAACHGEFGQGGKRGEYPRIAPSVEARAHRSVYWTEYSSTKLASESMPDVIARVDVESGRADEFRFEAGHFPSEAVFVPKPDSKHEADGWLAALVYDARAHVSYWAILDAAHVAAGPIARAYLDHHIPLGFHGAWVPA